MKYIEPDFAVQFRCLADLCPDTCCKDWEIILDADAIARYEALSGAFGDEVRAALTTDAENDTMFRLTNGHCPLLREDGLCRIQLALGEAGLCNTCRDHPRFWEEYGNTRELTLSISCPAAARLLLERTAPITFSCREDDTPVSGCNDLDPARYFTLRRARKTAIAIAQNRAYCVPDRLSLLILFAVRLQKLLDEAAYARLDPLLVRFSSPDACKRLLAHARRLRARPASFFPCWMLLNNMEHLTPDFPCLLGRLPAQSAAPAFVSAFDIQWENLTVYYLWRWFLKASVDGRVLARTLCCVFHVLCTAALFSCEPAQSAEALLRAASLYSKEVEHSDDNLLLLQRVFDRQTLRWKALLSLLQ